VSKYTFAELVVMLDASDSVGGSGTVSWDIAEDKADNPLVFLAATWMLYSVPATRSGIDTGEAVV
jgi:hypothetical protein